MMLHQRPVPLDNLGTDCVSAGFVFDDPVPQS
jgi:hypothetical protein